MPEVDDDSLSLTSTSPASDHADERPASEGRQFCPACGEMVDVGKKPGHCAVCGGFLRGNTDSLKHGGTSKVFTPEIDSRRETFRADILEQLIVDVIGSELVEDFVSSCLLRDRLSQHLDEVGPLTTRGARRAAMDLYLATSARIERLSVQLAEYRKPKSSATGDPITKVERVVIDSPEYLADATPTHRQTVPLIPMPDDTAPSAEAGGKQCAYCGNRRCVGADHPDFATLHALDPEQVAERANYRDAEMRESLRRA